MQAFQRAAAVFCMACIGAELVSFFAGQSWAGRCIKAAAGLYILAVLLAQLPRLPGKVLTAFFGEHSPGGCVRRTAGYAGNGDPDRGQSPTGSVLHRTVPSAVWAGHPRDGHAGKSRTAGRGKKAVAALPTGCTAAQKQAVFSLLQQTLGTAPTAAEESAP